MKKTHLNVSYIEYLKEKVKLSRSFVSVYAGQACRNFDAEASRDEIGQSAVETDRESWVTTNKGITWFLSRLETGGDPRTRIPTDWPNPEKEKEGDECKGDFQTSERDVLVLQQPTAACIMQVVGNGRMRNVCRADAASEVNLMRCKKNKNQRMAQRAMREWAKRFPRRDFEASPSRSSTDMDYRSIRFGLTFSLSFSSIRNE